jgi:hypothetical protein
VRELLSEVLVGFVVLAGNTLTTGLAKEIVLETLAVQFEALILFALAALNKTLLNNLFVGQVLDDVIMGENGSALSGQHLLLSVLPSVYFLRRRGSGLVLLALFNFFVLLV